MQFVSDRFKTQEMCDEAIDTCSFVFDSIRYMNQELCDKVASEDSSMLKYYHDEYVNVG